MKVYGIGTDIIEIDRFNKVSDRFILRCFAEQERAYLKGKPLENIAGCFAAKEAVAKALGTGFAGFWPSAIEISRNKAGKPEVVLHEKAAHIAEAAGIVSVEVSISHCKTAAIAMAMALTIF
ncbi:MAG: holo-ACP synthase [Defluviitaleaceae bacterium]|nr:holo-ACP synthase [Defluviitaleaceae bacterium]